MQCVRNLFSYMDRKHKLEDNEDVCEEMFPPMVQSDAEGLEDAIDEEISQIFQPGVQSVCLEGITEEEVDGAVSQPRVQPDTHSLEAVQGGPPRPFPGRTPSQV